MAQYFWVQDQVAVIRVVSLQLCNSLIGRLHIFCVYENTQSLKVTNTWVVCMAAFILVCNSDVTIYGMTFNDLSF